MRITELTSGCRCPFGQRQHGRELNPLLGLLGLLQQRKNGSATISVGRSDLIAHLNSVMPETSCRHEWASGNCSV